MRAKELIESLKSLIDLHGDIPVYVYSPKEGIDLELKRIDISIPFLTYEWVEIPKRITLSYEY